MVAVRVEGDAALLGPRVAALAHRVDTGLHLRDIVTLDDSATVTEALDLAIGHGFSRLPVLGDGGEDDVVGIAYTKDLMQAERNGLGDHAITEFSRSARFVPENKPVNRLMREMQAEKFHLALVADEYGAL